jgi:3-oxoacyl-[acyl-carrier-protein] synthase-3
MASLSQPDLAVVEPALRVGAAVCGLGAALPERVVSNDEVTSLLPVDAAWVERRTGIRERRWAAAADHLHELAAAAGRQALCDARVAAIDLDLVLVATVTADEVTPGCAPLVAAALGADRAGAVDVGAACSGFISALGLGAAMIEAGRLARVLVIGAEILSRHLDLEDRQTAVIFGDGAAAVLLEAAAGAHVGPVILGADGGLGNLITAPRDTGLIRMDGHSVFVEAVRRMSEASRDACTAAGVALADIDLFVFHQANERILTSLTERLELAPERVVSAIARTGNTSAASIPLALAHAHRAGGLQPGSRVLLAAFGAGVTWAATVITWGRDE